MKRPPAALVLGALTIAVLAVSVPGSLREAHEHGGFYLFSVRFFEDIPKRLAGPGRLRFIFQPADGDLPRVEGGPRGRAHRAPAVPSTGSSSTRSTGPPSSGRRGRASPFSSSWASSGLRSSSGCSSASPIPGAALVVGPVLITVPYATARTLAGALRSRQVG